MQGGSQMANNNKPKNTAPSIGSLLASLPNENNDNYTIVLKQIVLDNNLSAREHDLENYLKNTSSRYRFAAFYALLIICREHNNYSKYNFYVDKYANEFTMYKLHKIILSTYFRNKGILGEKNSYKRAIKFAEEACAELPTNLAVKHHYAAILVLAIEDKVDVDAIAINKAIERLDDVIIAFPKHAQYYCTQGRLLAATGDYHQGIVNIKKALDLEEIVDKESMVRIGEYNFYLMQIKMMIENEQVDKKIGNFNSSFQEMEHNLDSIKTQYLEYLAFFSSILAFILASVNIISKIDDFNKCAGIILMFAGSLIMVFGVFRMLLYFSSKIRFGITKVIICFVIGIVFLAIGFLIGNQTLLQWLITSLNI